MPERDRSHAHAGLVAALVALLLVVSGIGAAALTGGAGRLGAEVVSRAAVDESGVRVLRLQVPGVAPDVLRPAVAKPASATAVRVALAPVIHARSLGRRVAVSVSELDSGRRLATSGPATIIPASTMKLLTATAALQALGPGHRFSTRVVGRGHHVVLVGGGDPLLARVPDPRGWPHVADLTTLAGRTAQRLHRAGVRSVRLGYDRSLFLGNGVSRDWEPDYVPDSVVSPITSLWVDEGRERAGYAARSADPSRAAADLFAASLREHGVRVVSPVEQESAGSLPEVARVESPELSAIVQHTLELSDNEAAEVLARQVAIAEGLPATFHGGATGVQRVLRSLGLDLRGAVIKDGSGLSRDNRLSPRTMLDVLSTAARTPQLRTVVTGLSVAGFNGSLAYRFESAPRVALGEVRAKTGTLSGVSGLAGTVVTQDDRLLAFVVVADRIKLSDTLDARDQLDRVAAALARCSCG